MPVLSLNKGSSDESINTFEEFTANQHILYNVNVTTFSTQWWILGYNILHGAEIYEFIAITKNVKTTFKQDDTVQTLIPQWKVYFSHFWWIPRVSWSFMKLLTLNMNCQEQSNHCMQHWQSFLWEIIKCFPSGVLKSHSLSAVDNAVWCKWMHI